MPGQDLAERVAYLEGKVEEHSKAWDEVREELRNIHSRIDALSARIDSLADSLNARMDTLNERIDRTNARIDELDRKFSRYFLGIFGIQITILLSIIATLLRLTSP